jgi:hypothetical protein
VVGVASSSPDVGRVVHDYNGLAECWTTAFETLPSSAERNPERRGTDDHRS